MTFVFHTHDADANGVVSSSEFVQVIRAADIVGKKLEGFTLENFVPSVGWWLVGWSVGRSVSR